MTLSVSSVEKYLEQYHQIWNGMFDDLVPPINSLHAATVSASLFNLMPAIKSDDYYTAIKQIWRFETTAILDQHHASALIPYIIPEGEGLESNSHPVIFCSYHFGPYRLVAPYLLSKGVILTIVTDKSVAEAQGELFKELIREFCQSQDIPSDRCQWHDTSEPTLLISLMRDLKKGRSILFYIDANKGVGSEEIKKNTITIEFMKHPFFARAGVATLAQISRARLVPIIMKRNLSNQLLINAKMGPSFELEKERTPLSIEKACRFMWHFLECELLADPLPWEPWRYVHRFLDIAAANSDEANQMIIALNSTAVTDLTIDVSRFPLASVAEENYLFDRKTYQFYRISEKFRCILEKVATDRSVLNTLGRGTITKLLSMGVLIKRPS
jgi:hypothetical protein